MKPQHLQDPVGIGEVAIDLSFEAWDAPKAPVFQIWFPQQVQSHEDFHGRHYVPIGKDLRHRSNDSWVPLIFLVVPGCNLYQWTNNQLKFASTVEGG